LSGNATFGIAIEWQTIVKNIKAGRPAKYARPGKAVTLRFWLMATMVFAMLERSEASFRAFI